MFSVDDQARLIQLRQEQLTPRQLTRDELQEVLDIVRRGGESLPEWQIQVFRQAGLDVTGLEAA